MPARLRHLRSATPPLRGVGLFTGLDSSITFHPAPRGHGISFRAGGITTPALVTNIATNPTLPNVPPGFPIRNTTLTLAPGVHIATIEHAMSALRGLGITDCLVEISGPEVPIFDGSALPFVTALLPLLIDAGPAPEPLTLREPITLREGNATITATPLAEGCAFTYILDYGPTSPIPPQRASWSGDPDEYAADIAPARTFSLQHEAAAATAAGLFMRFTPQDLLVVGGDGRPIENAWRSDNEPARHKLLDLIGDVALLGRRLRAVVVGERSGHALTHNLSRRVLSPQ